MQASLQRLEGLRERQENQHKWWPKKDPSARPSKRIAGQATARLLLIKKHLSPSWDGGLLAEQWHFETGCGGPPRREVAELDRCPFAAIRSATELVADCGHGLPHPEKADSTLPPSPLLHCSRLQIPQFVQIVYSSRVQAFLRMCVRVPSRFSIRQTPTCMVGRNFVFRNRTSANFHMKQGLAILTSKHVLISILDNILNTRSHIIFDIHWLFIYVKFIICIAMKLALL